MYGVNRLNEPSTTWYECLRIATLIPMILSPSFSIPPSLVRSGTHTPARTLSAHMRTHAGTHYLVLVDESMTSCMKVDAGTMPACAFGSPRRADTLRGSAWYRIRGLGLYKTQISISILYYFDFVLFIQAMAKFHVESAKFQGGLATID